jgi:hypothetical protein
VAITYAAERAEQAPGNCGCFWLGGGGTDAAATFYKGLGIAASLSGDHAANVEPGADVNMIVFLAGPRYTWNTSRWLERSARGHQTQIFGQWLFGGVHAFNGIFPSGEATTASADAFAMQAGGGLTLALNKRLGVRLLQVDYQRTALPNNASNTQNDLRLAFGVTWRLGKR